MQGRNELGRKHRHRSNNDYDDSREMDQHRYGFFDRLVDDSRDLFNRTFGDDDWENFPYHKSQPKTNIYEDENSYYIEAALPGYKKEDISVEFHHNNSLTISAEKKSENEENNKEYHYRECRFGSVHRTFNLPENVKNEEISAKVEDGLLKISLPKGREIEHSPRNIEVQ